MAGLTLQQADLQTLNATRELLERIEKLQEQLTEPEQMIRIMYLIVSTDAQALNRLNLRNDVRSIRAPGAMLTAEHDSEDYVISMRIVFYQIIDYVQQFHLELGEIHTYDGLKLPRIYIVFDDKDLGRHNTKYTDKVVGDCNHYAYI